MSSNTVIQIENLGKRYLIGHENQEKYTALRDVISSKFQEAFSFRKRSDSFVNKEEIYALKDINIDIKRGEKIGIIGRNGAGKSTLLKILSRITEPTAGKVSIKGRISCLLEVGTGFHPELSGRENIYLNGAILGLKRAEVKDKFDEIVAFSEIEKFLDTPVKRYSSGMYSRLAFSVAAHLESEILIVDEVLAVGDVQFQKKCLGKMGEVSAKEGRTVLFVSHNLQAVQNLCTRVLLLNGGQLIVDGNPKEVVNIYVKTGESQPLYQEWKSPSVAPGNDLVRMKSVSLQPQADDANALISVNTPILLQLDFWNFVTGCTININFELYTITGECVFNMGSHNIEAEQGICTLESIIPANLLNSNIYYITITIVKNNSVPIYSFANCITFEVADVREGIDYYGNWPGIIRPKIDSLMYLKHPVSQS